MINKNKKADIPVTVLVMLTIAICIFALLAFYFSTKKANDTIKEGNLLEKTYEDSNNQKFLGGSTDASDERYELKWFIFKSEVLDYQIKYSP